MVGWLYIDGEVVAPLHRFGVVKHVHGQEGDHADASGLGLVRFECAAKLLDDRTRLRGEVCIELHDRDGMWRVRCLTARRLDRVFAIEALDLGPHHVLGASSRPGDDYLVVDGRPLCELHEVRTGVRLDPTERSVRDGCLAMAVPSVVWRRERGTRDGALARLAEPARSPLRVVRGVQDLTPPLLTDSTVSRAEAPVVEVVRLAERRVYRVELYAADWCSETAWVFCQVEGVRAIAVPSKPTSETAPRIPMTV